MGVRKLLASALFGALSPIATAETVSIDEALAAALSYDPGLTVARADVEAARASHRAARAQGGVQAGMMGSVGASEVDASVQTYSLTPWQAGVEARWTFFSSGAQSASVQQALFGLNATERNAEGARNQVAFDTLEAYASLLVSERTLVVNDQKVETLELRRDETNARFDQGLVTQTDVALSEARLAGAEAERESARAMKAAAQARLSRLTGLDSPETISELDLDRYTTPLGLEDATASALSANPSVQAARQAANAAQSGVKRAGAEFGPKLSLSARASASKEQFFFFDDQINEAGAYLNFEMPLFTSGLKGASRSQAVAARSRADAQLRMAELGVREAVGAIWGDIAARRLALDAAKRQETAAGKVAEGARREYGAGLRSLVDSLDAEDERRAAEIFRIQAEAGLFLSRAQLVLLMGGDLLNDSSGD